MTTTNSKQFRNPIRKYVLLSIDEICTVQDVHDEFIKWYDIHNRRNHPNVWEAFQYWLMCLPHVITVKYDNYAMEEQVKEWFLEAGMEWKPKKNFDYAKYYLYLLTKEFFWLCLNKERIEEFI